MHASCRVIVPTLAFWACRPPPPVVVIVSQPTLPAPIPSAPDAPPGSRDVTASPPSAAPTQPPPGPLEPTPIATSIELTAAVRKARGKVIRQVSPGDILAAGDDVALHVTLAHDAYLYVVYVDASGQPTDMFPTAGSPLVYGGGRRLPAPEHWWKLDASTGRVRFIVLSSAAPLDAVVRNSARWPRRRDLLARPRRHPAQRR